MGPGTLDDGYAIMHHDALATAVTAIRLASSPTDGGQSVTAADVGSQLLNLNSAYKVRGGSGTLIFSSRREGNAGNKPVPIVSVPAEQPDPTPYVTPST